MKSDTFEDIISLNEDIDYVTEHKRIKTLIPIIILVLSKNTEKIYCFI